MKNLTITKKEAQKIIFSEGEIEISLNLGISKTKIQTKNNIVEINNQNIPIDDFKKLKEDFCYLIEDNQLKKIAFFSDEANLYYKLVPTDDWPTIKLSATPMHRYTHLSPKQDTMLKMKEISPIKGKILDSCCGLGYTAIMASKEADEVQTFEKDKNVVFLAEMNPYSQELFNNKKIIINKEDVFYGIKKFRNDYFDRIIHDPPTFKRAPELYSKQFYLELFRVLKKEGIIYHYSPGYQKTHGKKFFMNIIKNLQRTGFKQIVYHEWSSGIRAVK